MKLRHSPSLHRRCRSASAQSRCRPPQSTISSTSLMSVTFGAPTYGTVSLVQDGSSVDGSTITLDPEFNFVSTGGHNVFSFNGTGVAAGDIDGITDTGPDRPSRSSRPDAVNPPFGTFQFGIACASELQERRPRGLRQPAPRSRSPMRSSTTSWCSAPRPPGNYPAYFAADVYWSSTPTRTWAQDGRDRRGHRRRPRARDVRAGSSPASARWASWPSAVARPPDRAVLPQTASERSEAVVRCQGLMECRVARGRCLAQRCVAAVPAQGLQPVRRRRRSCAASTRGRSGRSGRRAGRGRPRPCGRRAPPPARHRRRRCRAARATRRGGRRTRRRR